MALFLPEPSTSENLSPNFYGQVTVDGIFPQPQQGAKVVQKFGPKVRPQHEEL
jgi:hypothetical protein